jgi:hypothetical protein
MNITNYTNQFITITDKKIIYSNDNTNIALSSDIYDLLYESYDYLLKKYNNNQQILDDIFKSVKGLRNLSEFNYKIFDLLDYINVGINNNTINKEYDFYPDELNTHELTDDSDYESVEHSISRKSEPESKIDTNNQSDNNSDKQSELKIVASDDNIITKEDIEQLDIDDGFSDNNEEVSNDEYENVYNRTINNIIEDDTAINDNNESTITRRIKSNQLSNELTQHNELTRNDIIGDYDNIDEKMKNILAVSYKRRVSSKIQKFLVSTASSTKDDCTYCIKYNTNNHNKHANTNANANVNVNTNSKDNTTKDSHSINIGIIDDIDDKKDKLTFNIVKNNIKNKLKRWYSSLKQCVKDIPIRFSDCFSGMTCVCCSHDITIEEDTQPPVRQEMSDIENQIR